MLRPPGGAGQGGKDTRRLESVALSTNRSTIATEGDDSVIA